MCPLYLTNKSSNIYSKLYIKENQFLLLLEETYLFQSFLLWKNLANPGYKRQVDHYNDAFGGLHQYHGSRPILLLLGTL